MAEMHYEVNGADAVIEVDRTAGGFRVRPPGRGEFEVRADRSRGAVIEYTIVADAAAAQSSPERRFAAAVYATGTAVIVSYRGRTYRFQKAHTPLDGTRSDNDGSVTAPCGGIIVDILVEEGQSVSAGDPIAVVEAMKVMTPIDAPRAGIIRNLAAERGARVEQGAVLAKIEAPAQGDPAK